MTETVEVGPQAGPQTAFLTSNADIAFMGGSAGGGKTVALLLEALYDIHNPDFGAVIFRRTTRQVVAEGGLWDTASDLYGALGATPNMNELRWTFSSGAKITFAHMEHEKNRFDWQGAQIPLIGFDELTHFTWRQFVYMMSRNRSVSGAKSRIRGTLNPDADHWVRAFIDWWIGEDGYAIPERSGVIRWFIVQNDEVIWAGCREDLVNEYPDCLPKSFTFVRASLKDNPALTSKDPSYRASLHALPKVERERLLGGNWNIRPQAGEYFQRSWFPVVDAVPANLEEVRAWDLAATQKKRDPEDPDWTATVKLGRDRRTKRLYITHVHRERSSPGTVKRAVLNYASQDGTAVRIRMPQDPGQAGKAQAQDFVASLPGYRVVVKPVSGDKVTRAGPASSQAEAGNISVLKAPWNDAFFAELEAFPPMNDAGHDDMVDALSDAVSEFVETGGQGRVSPPKTTSRTVRLPGAQVRA